MTKSLPPNPSVKFLKLEAKNVLKAHRRSDSSCLEVLRHLNQFKDLADNEILNSTTCLQEVQFALSMEYGFKNWNELKTHAEKSFEEMGRETDEKQTESILAFCRNEPVRYRHLTHHIFEPARELDLAIRGYYGGDISNPTLTFIDNQKEPQIIALVNDGIRAEGSLSLLNTDRFKKWTESLKPRFLATTHREIKECWAEIVGDGRWGMNGYYSLSPDDFVDRGSRETKVLSPADSEKHSQFIEHNLSDPIVNRSVGGSGAVRRDFDFMCVGLPVTCYGAFDGDRITGMISVNPFTESCDEISVLFVDPAYRRQGYASSLLSAAVKDVFKRGHIPTYCAGGNNEDIVAMLTKLGFVFHSYEWSWWK